MSISSVIIRRGESTITVRQPDPLWVDALVDRLMEHSLAARAGADAVATPPADVVRSVTYPAAARRAEERKTEAPAAVQDASEPRVLAADPGSGGDRGAAPVLASGDVGSFIAESCEKVFQAFEPSAPLYAAYRAWCEARGLLAVGRHVFAVGLAAEGIRRCHGRRIAGRQTRTFEGLRLRGGSLKLVG